MNSTDRKIYLKPKEGRIEGICELAEALLKRGSMDFKEALSLKGKLQFAEGQLFYRVTAIVCRLLSRWAATGGSRPLTLEMSTGLRSIRMYMSVAGPRSIEPISSVCPVVIFTDGACEPEGTTIGGVLLVQGEQTQAFGAKLTSEAVDLLVSKSGQTQVIGQAEILPILVAKTVWADQIRNKKVVYFIDNDSARLALIKGYSPVLASLRIIMSCAYYDAKLRTSPWYARVPTKSNIADEPSRMGKTELTRLNARIVRPFLDDGFRWFEDVLV